LLLCRRVRSPFLNKYLVTLADFRVDEDLDMDADEVALGVDVHGKIVVEIHRGVLGSVPVDSRRSVHDDAPDTTISSKAVVKDNDVSHAVK
jgi:hypothetical protein